MFKGLKGFIYIGGYIIPIFASLISIYFFYKSGNSMAMLWAFITIFWILNAFISNVAMRQWKELYVRTQILLNQTIAYIRNHQEIITNDDTEEKQSKKST